MSDRVWRYSQVPSVEPSSITTISSQNARESRARAMVFIPLKTIITALNSQAVGAGARFIERSLKSQTARRHFARGFASSPSPAAREQASFAARGPMRTAGPESQYRREFARVALEGGEPASG